MSKPRTIIDELNGQLLIAMPGMGDPRFHKAVIFICSHSADGTMGVVINHPHKKLGFNDLLSQLSIESETYKGTVPKIEVVIGGPVQPEQGFVLHSPDYRSEGATLPVSDAIYMTATIDILKALGHGEGPSKALMALGYAGWGAGQLEGELLANSWLTCPCDASIIFETEPFNMYVTALAKLGIDPAMLVTEAGHG
eukprot:gene8990-9070_t